MTKMKASYRADFQTECTHESGAELLTDLPKDLGGEAKGFSPTDLLAASLASCMLTIMGIAAKKTGFDFGGATAEIEKEMASSPRRIARLVVRIRCPRTPSEHIRKTLEQAAMECPVHHSLHPNVRKEIDFVWGL
jgi:uncharacterized OsmC-like protein